MRALAIVAALLLLQSPSPQGPPPTQAQQRPVFRGGTHFVRVDAYPTKNGKIVEGLKPDDFEITEDGKPQAIESFDFIKYDTFTPEAERRDPISQRAGFDLAADPRYRVFVILVDMLFGNVHDGAVVQNSGDLHYIQSPLVNFLNRVLGPQDLYGFLTSRNSAKDLVLGQKTTTVDAQIDDLFRSAFIDRDDADDLDLCDKGLPLKTRFRLDQTYTALESLVSQLGSLREERKNVVFATNQLPRWRPDEKLFNQLGGGNMPRAGIVQGRVGIGDRPIYPGRNQTDCAGEIQRLTLMDFDSRYRELLRSAKRENVSFYVITPAGLQAPVTIAQHDALKAANDDLISLAHETDGIAIVDTNDLSGGMKKIADDLAAYYVLGYYTTNTKWDGALRSIKVKLKPSGESIRARRQYRAPTQAEIDALASAPAPGSQPAAAAPTDRENALMLLERASRPFAVYTALNGRTLTVITEVSPSSIQLGRWKSGAQVELTATTADGTPLITGKGTIEAGSYSTAVPLTIDPAKRPARLAVLLKGEGERETGDWMNLAPPSGTLVADPIAWRSASRIAPRPLAAFEFARNERIKVEWPVLAALDRREVRLLDRTGKPLPVDLPVTEDAAAKNLVVDISLSGLPHGDYLFELTAGAGATIEKRLLAIRIRQ